MEIKRNYFYMDKRELKWEDSEIKEIRERILNLRPDQIGALPFLVGVKFNFNELDEVVSEIKSNGQNSVNIDAIIYEAESKEKLLWWLNYFERENKRGA